MFLLLLLIVPLLASSEIVVDIQATGDPATSTVRLSGSVADVISDAEIRAFGITDNRLRDGAERHSGGRPQDVYVKSPTPWNDLYVSYNWEQVHRVLRPIRSEIVGIQSEPVILATTYMENNSSIEGTFSANILQSLQDTVTSAWWRNHELTVGQSIGYKIKMGFGSISGETSLSFSNNWGTSTSESVSKTVGSDASVSVVLQPKEKGMATLTATRGSMTVEIVYEASLRGRVACNYPRRYNGAHFWAYNITNVMGAINMPVTFASREILRIGFYANARVVLSNDNSTRVLKEIPASDLNNIRFVKQSA